MKNRFRNQLVSCIILFFLFTQAIFSQNMTFKTDDYPTEWKEIEGFDQKGLPKSALEKVVALHKKAMADNNPAQIVKTLIYRARYTTQLEEDGFIKAVNVLENEEKTAAFPTKSVLQSMLAELYAGYLENNVWRFRNRTKTVNFQQEDIRTWDIERINNEAARLYRLSLYDERIKQVPLKTFNAVTLASENGENTEPANPMIGGGGRRKTSLNAFRFFGAPCFRFFHRRKILFD